VGKATMHGGHTVAIHSVIFEKNKKDKSSTSSI